MINPIKAIKFSFFIISLLGTGAAQASLWQVDKTADRGLTGDEADTEYFVSDEQALRGLLSQIPSEQSGQGIEIELPMPDGSVARYKIVESSIMEVGLAEKFPQIKTYKVFGLDHPGASGRVDISPKGFRAMIMSPYGQVFIDPIANSISRYTARTAGTLKNQSGNAFQCNVASLESNQNSSLNFSPLDLSARPASRTAGSLSAYRLAVSATPEYVTAAGGTLSLAMAEIITMINRVNEIYERDMGIRLYLIADNDLLIDMPPGRAGFTNNNTLLLLSENQIWVDSHIDASAYDVGQVFSTEGGGRAWVESACSSLKVQGASGINDLTRSELFVNLVAHEFGHQFGANHSYNGSEGSCVTKIRPQRNDSTAYEPGSGSTIMSYAGLCDVENIQTFSDSVFHAGSIEEINDFVNNTSTGGSCATLLPLIPTNADPVSVDAGIDRTIPANTAFRLTGSGSDPDSGDALSYQWEQVDAGGVTPTNASSIGTDTGSNPLFRSWVPQPNTTREFPRLESQLAGSDYIGEVLPTTSRDLTFRFTVRDCKSGQASDDVTVSVDDSSGPFVITSHSMATTFNATSNPIITWNVAGTNLPPVNCPEVDIELLTFSANGSTYANTLLASNTVNDGTETVTISDRSNAQARFRVSCSDSVFYDISDADLNIVGTIPFTTTGNSATISSAASCGTLDVIGAPPNVGVGSGGGGSIDEKMLLYLLIFLTNIVLILAFRQFLTRV